MAGRPFSSLRKVSRAKSFPKGRTCSRSFSYSSAGGGVLFSSRAPCHHLVRTLSSPPGPNRCLSSPFEMHPTAEVITYRAPANSESKHHPFYRIENVSTSEKGSMTFYDMSLWTLTRVQITSNFNLSASIVHEVRTRLKFLSDYQETMVGTSIPRL